MDLEERIEVLERRVNELEAIEGIRNTMSRYARAIDYEQYDVLESIIADDIVLQAKPWWKETKGKEDALNTFRSYRTTYQFPHRYFTNENIHIDGEFGKCLVYWLVFHSYNGKSYIGWGTIDWVFRLEGGIWKIARMAIDIQTMTSLDEGWGMEQERVIPFPPPS